MIFEHANYRAYLKATLAERTGLNPAYSMSAWARKLGVAPGFFSEVLNGKKNLSQEGVLKISHQLGLTQKETEYFSLLVQQETTKNADLRERVLKRLNDIRPRTATKVHNLQVDLFRAISDWHHFAILELTFLDGYELSAKNAAKKLGITQLEAEAAIERLLRLELLTVENGRLKKTTSYVFVKPTIPNEAANKFHEQIMNHAARALKLPRSQRKSRSEILPISTDIMPEVEKILDDAAEKILALARESASKNEVYGLSLQFAPLSPERKLK